MSPTFQCQASTLACRVEIGWYRQSGEDLRKEACALVKPSSVGSNRSEYAPRRSTRKTLLRGGFDWLAYCIDVIQKMRVAFLDELMMQEMRVGDGGVYSFPRDQPCTDGAELIHMRLGCGEQPHLYMVDLVEMTTHLHLPLSSSTASLDDVNAAGSPVETPARVEPASPFGSTL